MADEITPTTQAVGTDASAAGAVTEPAATTQPAEPFDADRAMETIKNLREIEKQYKKDRKQLEQLLAEKKQKEDAELSEIEKLRKSFAETADENARLKLDLTRREVISETGLPAVFADRLKGTTKEEMTADANELLKLLPQPEKPRAPHLPTSNPSGAGTNQMTDEARREFLGLRR